MIAIHLASDSHISKLARLESRENWLAARLKQNSGGPQLGGGAPRPRPTVLHAPPPQESWSCRYTEILTLVFVCSEGEGVVGIPPSSARGSLPVVLEDPMGSRGWNPGQLRARPAPSPLCCGPSSRAVVLCVVSDNMMTPGGTRPLDRGSWGAHTLSHADPRLMGLCRHAADCENHVLWSPWPPACPHGERT